MSEPTIWDIAMGGNPPEKFVPYSDYARLKAEVERLTLERNGFQQAMKANQSILETKRDVIERLLKAGEALIFCMNLNSASSGNALRSWENAKEGKPSV